MCTGRPSADDRSWLSAVVMPQEKSRALLITAERAARSSVLDISRTMPSSRLAMTAITTGSSLSGRPLRFTLDDARLARPGLGARLRSRLRLVGCAWLCAWLCAWPWGLAYDFKM